MSQHQNPLRVRPEGSFLPWLTDAMTMRKTRSTLLLIAALAVSAIGSFSASDNMTPLELVAGTPKGGLRNPYSHASAAAEEGHKIYMSLDCSSCHGGGGGMAAPLTNPIWIYGNDDDTLFRLIALGTVEFQKQGYSRKGSEFVVGPMPPFGETIQTDDDLWKVIAWIRSVNPPLQRR
jgi:mono/diheme cytochrome c family protein